MIYVTNRRVARVFFPASFQKSLHVFHENLRAISTTAITVQQVSLECCCSQRIILHSILYMESSVLQSEAHPTNSGKQVQCGRFGLREMVLNFSIIFVIIRKRSLVLLISHIILFIPEGQFPYGTFVRHLQ